MTPLRHSLLAFLSLLASIHALPAAIPKPSNSIGLGKPSYSISWDVGLPQPTKAPEEPEPTSYPPVSPPQPSSQISLSPPSFSVSWDVNPGPTAAPEKPEGPGYPSPPPTKPSDQISLGPPSFSISIDTGFPHPTGALKGREQPKPSDQISLNPPSFSISFDPGLPAPTDAPEEPEPTSPKPSDAISLGPPSYSISWDPGYTPPTSTSATKTMTNKPWKPTRQPLPPKPKPTDQISLGNPSASISLAMKRQDDPEPTDFPELPEDPEFPEDPEGPIIVPPFPPLSPPNSIGIQPPAATISWGKREAEAVAQVNTIGIIIPTSTPSNPWDPPAGPPQSGYISWAKQDPEPTEAVAPVSPRQIGLNPPKGSISWGKRTPEPSEAPVAEPQPNTIGIIFPTYIALPGPFDPPSGPPHSGYISWGKREEAVTKIPKPTHVLPTPITDYPKPSKSLCTATATVTVIPVCDPPLCPHGQMACDLNVSESLLEKRVRPREEGAVIEKTIVTVETKTLVLPPPTPVKPTKPVPVPSSCSKAVTRTVTGACPTYTCVPWCEAAQVVR